MAETHPLRPEHSTGSDRPHRPTLLDMVSRFPLLQTQVNAVWVRGQEVIEARLFVRRSLSYSVVHRGRHCTPLVPRQQRDQTIKQRNVDDYILEQLWKRKETPVPSTSNGQNPSKPAGARKPKNIRILSSPLANPTEITKPTCVDYVYVLLYPAGESYQMRDYVILERKPQRHSGHACLLCPMRCDSLVHLIRHLEGLHPSVGCEYDPEGKWLYVWFAPELEFRRKPVVGFMDRWGSVINRRRGKLTHYKHHQPVMQWIGKRFVRPEERVSETLPVFSRKNLDAATGIPVTPIRHFFHSNTAQPIRPDRHNMVEHESDDEEEEYQIQHKHDQINTFPDCYPAEKQFMCLWETFIRPGQPVPSGGLREILYRFAERLAECLETVKVGALLCGHLSMLRRLHGITQNESMQVMRVYQAARNCDGLLLEKLKKA